MLGRTKLSHCKSAEAHHPLRKRAMPVRSSRYMFWQEWKHDPNGFPVKNISSPALSVDKVLVSFGNFYRAQANVGLQDLITPGSEGVH